jgi:hypothetical protein
MYQLNFIILLFGVSAFLGSRQIVASLFGDGMEALVVGATVSINRLSSESELHVDSGKPAYSAKFL